MAKTIINGLRKTAKSIIHALAHIHWEYVAVGEPTELYFFKDSEQRFKKRQN